MLLGQLLVVVLSAVKRFDAVALHAWESAREGWAACVRAVRVWLSEPIPEGPNKQVLRLGRELFGASSLRMTRNY